MFVHGGTAVLRLWGAENEKELAMFHGVYLSLRFEVRKAELLSNKSASLPPLMLCFYICKKREYCKKTKHTWGNILYLVEA